MRRRAWLWVAGFAVAMGIVWGGLELWDARPNPIRVRVGEDAAAVDGVIRVRATSAPDEPGARFTEVLVTRDRPLPMSIRRIPVVGAPPGADEPLLRADADELAVEQKALAEALDAWIAQQGGRYRISQTWTSESTERFLWLDPDRVQVGLHARLVEERSDPR